MGVDRQMRYTNEADVDIQLARLGKGNPCLSMCEAIKHKKDKEIEKEALHNYNLEKCHIFAFFATTVIGDAINQYRNGQITHDEVIEQVKEYRDRFFNKVEEYELKKHISRFEVERIWNEAVK